ncbi:MAG TPA: hypothetical protein VI873_00905, partial [Candidatus Peribacteraceae bacterium]|nr:hypothetical protein [Candidatus Peribacteraceae bacterium]
MSPSLLSFEISLPRTIIVLGAVAMIACLDLAARVERKHARYALGVLVGTILAFGLILATQAILSPAVPKQGQAIALGVFLIVIAWRLLFGDWDAETKATVLGTFVFWIFFHLLSVKTPDDRLVHLIAIGTAAIPAVVWCAIFLPYHRERLGVVFSMIFAGMLSTIPILFYDALVRRGVELNFFLFTIAPQSFTSSANLFVTGAATGISPLQTSLLAMFVSFLFVGFIEEGSKLWILWRAGRRHVTSIDDAMQMA